MQKFLSSLLPLVLACGAVAPGPDLTVIEGVTNLDRPDETTQQLPTARRIATLEHGSERLDLLDVSDPDDAFPDIILSGLSQERYDMYPSLQAHALEPVTPAEIWLAFSGTEELPELLARDHARRVVEEDRSAEYQRFDVNEIFDSALVEKTIPTDVDLFRGQTNGSVEHNLCWGHHIKDHELVGNGTGFPNVYVCSSENPGGGDQGNAAAWMRESNVNAATACSRSFNTNSTVLASTYNGTTGSEVAQLCYAGGTNAWACLSTVNFPPNFYYVQTWLRNGQAHRIGVGVQIPSMPPSPDQWFGAAILISDLPAFPGPFCVGG